MTVSNHYRCSYNDIILLNSNLTHNSDPHGPTRHLTNNIQQERYPLVKIFLFYITYTIITYLVNELSIQIVIVVLYRFNVKFKNSGLCKIRLFFYAFQ